MSAEFSVEAAAQTNKRVVEVGVKVFIPLLSYAMLEGLVVDFVDTRTKSGFRFTDPNKGPCACSSSTAEVPQFEDSVQAERERERSGSAPCLSSARRRARRATLSWSAPGSTSRPMPPLVSRASRSPLRRIGQ